MVEPEIENSGEGLTESNDGTDGADYSSCKDVVPVMD